jgi:hypothetical protein
MNFIAGAMATKKLEEMKLFARSYFREIKLDTTTHMGPCCGGVLRNLKVN